MSNYCITCGTEIPEGTLVCIDCNRKVKEEQRRRDRGPTWSGYYSRIAEDKTKYSRKKKHRNKSDDYDN